MAQKPRDAVVNFFYQNLQRHRAVLPAIARLLFQFAVLSVVQVTTNSQQIEVMEFRLIAASFDDRVWYDSRVLS